MLAGQTHTTHADDRIQSVSLRYGWHIWIYESLRLQAVLYSMPLQLSIMSDNYQQLCSYTDAQCITYAKVAKNFGHYIFVFQTCRTSEIGNVTLVQYESLY